MSCERASEREAQRCSQISEFLSTWIYISRLFAQLLLATFYSWYVRIVRTISFLRMIDRRIWKTFLIFLSFSLFFSRRSRRDWLIYEKFDFSYMYACISKNVKRLRRPVPVSWEESSSNFHDVIVTNKRRSVVANAIERSLILIFFPIEIQVRNGLSARNNWSCVIKKKKKRTKRKDIHSWNPSLFLASSELSVTSLPHSDAGRNSDSRSRRDERT